MSSRKTKWSKVIADLQASPGEWLEVADDVGPSIPQRLRDLGAEVRTEISSPRTSERSYDRYTVYALWPVSSTGQAVAAPSAEELVEPHQPNSKWAHVVAELQATPGEWRQVADDAGPSTIQRLRALGAEVQTDSVAPRTDGRTYSRYIVFARWPTPETELQTLQTKHAALSHQFLIIKADVKAADEEYAADKKRLNRSAYRRKQAREKYEPLLEELDQLTALINRLKTEKD